MRCNMLCPALFHGNATALLFTTTLGPLPPLPPPTSMAPYLRFFLRLSPNLSSLPRIFWLPALKKRNAVAGSRFLQRAHTGQQR